MKVYDVFYKFKNYKSFGNSHAMVLAPNRKTAIEIVMNSDLKNMLDYQITVTNARIRRKNCKGQILD